MDVLVYWRVSFHGWDDFLHEESHVNFEGILWL